VEQHQAQGARRAVESAAAAAAAAAPAPAAAPAAAPASAAAALHPDALVGLWRTRVAATPTEAMQRGVGQQVGMGALLALRAHACCAAACRWAEGSCRELSQGGRPGPQACAGRRCWGYCCSSRPCCSCCLRGLRGACRPRWTRPGRSCACVCAYVRVCVRACVCVCICACVHTCLIVLPVPQQSPLVPQQAGMYKPTPSLVAPPAQQQPLCPLAPHRLRTWASDEAGEARMVPGCAPPSREGLESRRRQMPGPYALMPILQCHQKIRACPSPCHIQP